MPEINIASQDTLLTTYNSIGPVTDPTPETVQGKLDSVTADIDNIAIELEEIRPLIEDTKEAIVDNTILDPKFAISNSEDDLLEVLFDGVATPLVPPMNYDPDTGSGSIADILINSKIKMIAEWVAPEDGLYIVKAITNYSGEMDWEPTSGTFYQPEAFMIPSVSYVISDGSMEKGYMTTNSYTPSATNGMKNIKTKNISNISSEIASIFNINTSSTAQQYDYTYGPKNGIATTPSALSISLGIKGINDGMVSFREFVNHEIFYSDNIGDIINIGETLIDIARTYSTTANTINNEGYYAARYTSFGYGEGSATLVNSERVYSRTDMEDKPSHIEFLFPLSKGKKIRLYQRSSMFASIGTLISFNHIFGSNGITQTTRITVHGKRMSL